MTQHPRLLSNNTRHSQGFLLDKGDFSASSTTFDGSIASLFAVDSTTLDCLSLSPLCCLLPIYSIILPIHHGRQRSR
jgi:hypothetical protein